MFSINCVSILSLLVFGSCYCFEAIYCLDSSPATLLDTCWEYNVAQMTDDPKKCQMWLGFSKSIGVVTAFSNNLCIVLPPKQIQVCWDFFLYSGYWLPSHQGKYTHQGQYISHPGQYTSAQILTLDTCWLLPNWPNWVSGPRGDQLKGVSRQSMWLVSNTF